MISIKQLAKKAIDRRVVMRLRRVIHRIDGQVGTWLLPMMHKRASRIAASSFTLGDGRRPHLFDRFLRAALVQKAIGSKDATEIAALHRNYWQSSNGGRHHVHTGRLFEDIFLTHFTCVEDELTRVLSRRPDFRRVCEIGAGNGKLLNYLAQKLPSLTELIGIDLCPETIEQNATAFNDPRLQWVAADAAEWIREHGQPATVFVSNRGVFEYFAQSQLESLLSLIAQQLQPAVVVAIEPVAIEHDLERQLDSISYGSEFSFSHNYPHLFRQAGFEVKELKSVEFYSFTLRAYLAEGQDR